MFLFDLAAPRAAGPAPLSSESYIVTRMWFSPDGSWLASEHSDTAILWNTTGARSTVLGRHEPPNVSVAFTRDGHLLSASDGGVLRHWPLSLEAGENVRELVSAGPGRPYEGAIFLVAVDPGGRSVVAAKYVFGEILVVPLDGSKPSVHQLKLPAEGHVSVGVGSLDAGGRFLAVWAPHVGTPELNGIRILDLATGDVRTLDTHATGEGRCEAAVMAGNQLAAGLGSPSGSATGASSRTATRGSGLGPRGRHEPAPAALHENL
jgi:WD40 repeat protein